MADDKKAGGMRDIKDLKARLGLAKGAKGGAAPAPTQGSGTGPQAIPPPVQRGGGVVPPPMQRGGGGYVPPPPGFPQPQAPEPEPEPIDARHDPFGAMARQAQQQAHAVPQQIIPGFDDGKPVEAVNQGSKVRLFVSIGIGVVCIGLGIALGGVSAGNKSWNETIKDAKRIKENFVVIDGVVGKLGDTLKKQVREGRLAPDPKDEAFLAELETFKFDEKVLQDWKTIVLNSNYRYMNKVTVDALMQYYLSLNALYMLVAQHVVATRNDIKVLEKAFEKGGARYAAFFRKQQPGAGGWPFLDVVELVRPVCDPDPAKGELICEGENCGPSAKCMGKTDLQWEYRMDAGKTTGKLKFAVAPEAITSETLIPLSDSRLFTEFKIGAPATLAQEQYMRRVSDIERAYGAIGALRTLVLERLEKFELKKSKRFSF